jgi:putative Ca2+/H+ antiporter (TMEM165/GDT1 family)
MFAVLIATYGAVFLAEIVGDKLLYTTGVLATRYRPMPIVIGVSIAFMAKMAVAVLIGEEISRLPPLLVAGLTTVSFVGVAVALWRKPLTRKDAPREPTSAGKATAVSFATIFFSEWGDVGQVTAAAMAAKFGAPAMVWVGAVAAMVTKGLLAASVGAGARRWIESHLTPKTIRYAGVAAMLVLGTLSVIETLTSGHA